MSRRRQQPEHRRQAVAWSPHPWLLGALTTLVVSRPLLPSEGVAWRGDGLIWPLTALLLLSATCVASASRTSLAGSSWTGWKKVDLLALLYLGWYAVSALWAIKFASPRPALNMLCEQAGLVALYFVARQTLARAEELRALTAAMFGLAVALSCYGLFQYFVSLPATRAHYLADPDAALREIGQWFPPNSKERYAFEQRLASVEPMATFALTNSLAGFLVPWFIAALGPLLVSATNVNRSSRIGVAAALTVGAACLLLTKSRSGYIGFACGVGLIVLSLPAVQRLRSVKVWSACAAVLMLLIAWLGWQGGLDWPVLSEAPKSLGYRGEYWQAALAMSRDAPLLGCGPGNFADSYTRYKLPASSEEISDPHNFLLEIVATTGWPAALLFVAFLALVFWPRPKTSPPTAVSAGEPTAPIAFPWSVPCGALVGFAAALLAAPLMGVEPEPLLAVAGVAIVAAMMYLVRGWIHGAAPHEQTLASALVALLVNLLAAGGFGFPGVAGTLWLLAAMTVNQCQSMHNEPGRPAKTAGRATTPTVGWLTASASLAAAGVALVFAYRPAVACQSLMAQADHHLSSASSRLVAATQADPWSDEAWRRLASVRFANWRDAPSPDDFAEFERAAATALQLRPNSSGLRLEFSDRYFEAYQFRRDAAWLERAIELCQQAVRLYPNDAPRQARLAVALAAGQRREEAATVAAEALRLSDLSPHVEHQLWNEARAEVVAIAAGEN